MSGKPRSRTIQLSVLAVRDIDQIATYLRRENPAALDTVFAAFETSLTVLASHPFAGRAGRQRGTRELVVPRYPYILVYRSNAQAILLVRVIHVARDWPRDLKPHARS